MSKQMLYNVLVYLPLIYINTTMIYLNIQIYKINVKARFINLALCKRGVVRWAWLGLGVGVGTVNSYNTTVLYVFEVGVAGYKLAIRPQPLSLHHCENHHTMLSLILRMQIK